jgi:hypothetical protein
MEPEKKYADDDIFIFYGDSETEQDLNGGTLSRHAIITVFISRSFVVKKLCPVYGNVKVKVASHKIRSA